jgi:hypothetical protein
MNEEKDMPEQDAEMRGILETLLIDDLDITARAVARLHPSIKAASSITRSESRAALLAEFQKRQHEYRAWRGRVGKQSAVDTATALAKKDHRIAELEAYVQMLTTSHVALLRAVGAMGGFSRWAQFFEKHQDVRRKLTDLGAIPESVAPMQVTLTTKTSSRENTRK